MIETVANLCQLECSLSAFLMQCDTLVAIFDLLCADMGGACYT